MPNINQFHFKIRFVYNSFPYSADIAKFDSASPKEIIYQVLYKSDNVEVSYGDFQMCSEELKDHEIEWRQRRGPADSIDLDPLFVSLIGLQIEQWQKLHPDSIRK